MCGINGPFLLQRKFVRTIKLILFTKLHRLPEGRQAYCSDACKAEGNRRKSRERMRKMREKRPGGCYDLPPPKA